jgi:IS5 family transposase
VLVDSIALIASSTETIFIFLAQSGKSFSSWHWFCGYETMQYHAPIDPTTLSRLRSRLGSEKLEILLKQTLEVAKRGKFLDAGDLDLVNVDATVQPKAIAFPTDTKLYYKMIRTLGRLAKKPGWK